MSTLRTNRELLEKLKPQAGKKLTARELHEQKVSFVYGNIDAESGATRDRVREVIEEAEGTAEA